MQIKATYNNSNKAVKTDNYEDDDDEQVSGTMFAPLLLECALSPFTRHIHRACVVVHGVHHLCYDAFISWTPMFQQQETWWCGGTKKRITFCKSVKGPVWC